MADVTQSACGAAEYESAFSSFGISTTDENIPWAYVVWGIAFVVTIPISCLLSCLLGKISGNYCCVPMVSSDKFELKESNHKDAVNFTGFAVKLKAVLKAVSLSGMAVIIVTSWIMMGEYEACPEYETINGLPVEITMICAWIASFTGYILVWKIDVSLGVTKLKIWQKLMWAFSEKLIILICGSSFVRAIYLQETVAGSGVCCYYYSQDLMLTNVFTIIYIAMFPFVWIVQRLRIKALIMIALNYAWAQYVCCGSSNCCCEIKTKPPTGPVGKVIQPCASKVFGCLCGKLAGFVLSMTAPLVMCVIAPLFCLFIRFGIFADKWNNRVSGSLDISDVVFIWITVVAFTFFAVVAVERMRNKFCPPKEKVVKEEDVEVELHAAIGKEEEDKEDKNEDKKDKKEDKKQTKEDKEEKKEGSSADTEDKKEKEKESSADEEEIDTEIVLIDVDEEDGKQEGTAVAN
eukprot:120117_1